MQKKAATSMVNVWNLNLQDRMWAQLEPRARKPIHSSQHNPVIIRGFIYDFCDNTTIHCMRYISERERHWTERLLWGFLCLLAFSGTVYLSILIWNRFVTSPTMSVIETTNFPISNIPFPSVTLCDTNRVLWSKAMSFQEEYFADASNETIELFHSFLEAMALVEFGDFDLIQENASYAESPKMAALNVSELMLRVMPTCKDMFYTDNQCWWRNIFYDCCDIFELQRTEYGYCYAFNSEVSEVSTGARRWFDSSAYYLKPPENIGSLKEELRPHRTSSYGPWGGLRFTLTTSNDSPPRKPIASGVIMMISNPQDFPENGRIIPSGHSVSVDIDGYVTYTVDRVRSLKLEDRNCLYIDEDNNMNLGGYLLHNCIVECHRNYTIKYCNCTPYFFYSYRDNESACNTTGYLCLSKNNNAFNYHKSDDTNPYFDKTTEGMECSCQRDCSYPQYSIAVSVSQLMKTTEYEEENETTIFFDIHFQHPAMVRYRTDVVYGWLDLVVAFGGIAGLCLGCSLLSGAETIYYFTLRLYHHYKLVHGTSSFYKQKPQNTYNLKRPEHKILSPLNAQTLNLAFIKASESVM